MQRFKVFLFLLLTVLTLGVGKLIKPWATFIPEGYPTGEIIKIGNYIIFGTNYSKLYFVNTDNKEDSKFLDLNSGDVKVQDKKGDKILVVSGDKLFLVDVSSKKIKWQTENPNQYFFDKGTITGNIIIANNLDGSVSGYSFKDGRNIWIFKPGGRDVISEMIHEGNLHYSGEFLVNDNTVYFASPTKTIYALSITDGTIAWSKNLQGLPVAGPNIKDGTINVSTSNGETFSFDKKSGNTLWSKIEKITDNPVNERVLYDETGEITFFSPDFKKAVWKYNIGVPANIYSKPFIDTFNIYVSGANGAIYKMNKQKGRPQLGYFDRGFNVTSEIKKIDGREMVELTVTSNAIFENPWSEAKLDVWFSPAIGQKIYIPGFYYDKNVWKVRFVPPSSGVWKWNMEWVPFGYKLYNEGEVIVSTDSQDFYLKVGRDNPKRLTLDGNTAFNGVGISDTMIDFNYNGTQLDDWAVGDDSAFSFSSKDGQEYLISSDKIRDTHDFINIYGRGGAQFNLFRWNIGNASPALWLNLGFPSKYSISQGKIYDSLTEALRNDGIHNWATLFGNDIPFKFSDNPNEIYLLKDYAKYVFARYGYAIDVWEIANEVAVPKKTGEMVSKTIKSLDFENRPISIGSDPYNVTDGTVIAPHWYESETLYESDIKTSKQIENYDRYSAPVIIAEQGNKTINYDQLSSLRMRVRLWTAFFKQGILIFWNQSDARNIKSGVFSNANIYLGEEERNFIKLFVNYSEGFPITSKKVEYSIPGAGVRGYGLTSETLTAGYFFHYKNPYSQTSFGIKVYTQNGGEVTWIDPATGRVVQKNWCNPGICRLNSPIFISDISFKIKRPN